MTIGLLGRHSLAAAFSDPVHAAFAEGAATAADAAGYGLLLLSAARSGLARMLHSGAVDGIVAWDLAEESTAIRQVRRAALPLVLVDVPALPEHGAVDSSEELGGRSAARHLLSLGHRRFAVVGIEPPGDAEAPGFVAGPSEIVVARRLAGFRQGLAAGGIRLGDSRVVEGPGSVDGGMAAFHGLWEDGHRPTAVLALSDVQAVGVLRAARSLGLRVPRDLSVVGFDDLELASQANPPLTTVRQPIRQKGGEAVRILLRLVGGEGDRPEHRTLDTRLVVRGSTGPAPRRDAPRSASRPARDG
jgi:DNA-binding LacI/PurR family transcriptional regulator